MKAQKRAKRIENDKNGLTIWSIHFYFVTLH